MDISKNFNLKVLFYSKIMCTKMKLGFEGKNLPY